MCKRFCFKTLFLMLVLFCMNVVPAQSRSRQKVDKEVHVYFNFRSARLLREQTVKLEPVCAYLKSHPKRSVSLVGYTSMEGSAHQNKLLAKWRVEVVSQWLEEHGIEESRIRTNAMGQSEKTPVEDCRVVICVIQ